MPDSYLPLHRTDTSIDGSPQHHASFAPLHSFPHPSDASSVPPSSSVMLGPRSNGMRSRLITNILLATHFILFLIFLITMAFPPSARSLQSVDHEILELRMSAERASNETLFWGTYRPGLYFGTRPRLPQSVLTGLMWFGLDDYKSWNNIRHSCEQGDNFQRYGYLKHDGRYFGMQELIDDENRYSLRTEFVKYPGGEHGGDWAVRISGEPNVTSTNLLLPPELPKASIIFYIGFEGSGELRLVTEPSKDGIKGPVVLLGETEELGTFSLQIVDEPETDINTNVWGASITDGNVWRAKDLMDHHLNTRAHRIVARNPDSLPDPEEVFSLDNDISEGANVYFFQKNVEGAFEFDVIFRSGSSPTPQKGSLDSKIRNAYRAFDRRFERVFGLEEKGYDEQHIKFAQAALSNLLGGIGYFYGDSIVDYTPDEEADRDELDEDEFPVKTPHPEHTDPRSLFSATPSRSFFPRGFLWDEGFHQLLVGSWDNDLSLEIVRSWFSLMDDNGWIAREQILGDEARSKVPEKFQTQFPQYANPPTLIFPVRRFMERLISQEDEELDIDNLLESESATKKISSSTDPELVRNRRLFDGRLGTDYLQQIYPYLRRFYHWFRRTQKGEIKRWGRRAPSKEAYRWRGRTLNHTLTSGLDDYPRAVPHPGELHLDLLCWMGYMSKTLSMVAERLGEEDDMDEYDLVYENILANIDALHWNEDEEVYCDLTVNEEDESEFVCHKGYVTLFPLLLGLLPADSPNLDSLLNLMRDTDHLWSPYGLRSLAKTDPYFGEGENYWRGPVWMNMNFLALSSLHKNYVNVDGPYQKKAAKIYKQLHKNVVENVFKQYNTTGYLWEQYSSENGAGQRSHPFSGWSALVVLMMSEIY